MSARITFYAAYDDAIIPQRQHEGDAGFDLYAREGGRVPPGEVHAVGTGVVVAIPHGYVGLITPRSGNAARHNITVMNTPGIIDAGYRGELKVLLYNAKFRPDDLSGAQAAKPAWIEDAFTWEAGDRIAQLLVVPAASMTLEVAVVGSDDELPAPPDGRGGGGFGSTGV